MRITLQTITIESFKGVKRFAAHFDGHNATIKAENGTGKTTIFDAFKWLLHGKDSADRKDFGIWPLQDGVPVRGVEVKVQAVLLADGRPLILRKELHEKIVKGEIKGYETFCWVDDVPKKVGEYQAVIESLADEETSKILTDLTYFNTKLHWSDRRKVLLALAGKVGTPKGFAHLLSSLNGRTIEEQAKMLAEQKGRYEKEQKDIGPRIDELQRGLPETPVDDESAEKQRAGLQTDLSRLETLRKGVLDAESDRQKKIEAVNKLTVERLHRQSQMRSEQKQTQALFNEKSTLNANLAEMRNALIVLNGKGKLLVAEQNNLRAQIEAKRNDLASIRDACKRLQETKPHDAICFNCGQPLPAAMREETETRNKTLYAEKVHTGNELKRQIDALGANRVAKAEAANDCEHQRDKVQADIEAAEHAADKRIAQIDALLANPPEPDYTADEKYRKLTEQIESLQKEVGEPASEQLAAIETQQKALQEQLNRLNEALAQADRARKDQARIAELGAREKELAQKIADCNKELDELKRYNLEQAKLIEAAVNDKFQHVTWKMFDYFLNGDIDDRMCTALYHGTPYPDLSTGESIIVGPDIINVLSGHYDVSMPIFIDHMESLTLPLEATAQVIGLKAVEGVKSLKIEVAETAVAA